VLPRATQAAADMGWHGPRRLGSLAGALTGRGD
jgi:hypothetical protein